MSYRLTQICTRSGDDGKTNLGTSERIDKNQPRIELLGTLDELNCTIGLILSDKKINPQIAAYLLQIQQELFDLGSELCPPYHPLISTKNIEQLEKILNELNNALPPLKEFILPNGDFGTAACHLARAVCRRAERCMVTLNQQEKLNAHMLIYLNRLSDVLFVIARVLAKEQHTTETLWKHERQPKE